MESTWEKTVAVITLVGGSIAFITAFIQYRRAQQWKRAEWVASEMKEFFDNHLTRVALQILDWEERYILLFPNNNSPKGYVFVSDQMAQKALTVYNQGTVFSNEEVEIRDAFDCFLDGLERLESYINTDLIKDQDIVPYIRYWANLIVVRQRVANQKGQENRFTYLAQFAASYHFNGAWNLITRIGK